MVPIHYDDKNFWEVVTDVILMPNCDESRLFDEEVDNYKRGITKSSKVGYQYQLSKNFPFLYESVEVPKKIVKEKAKKVTNEIESVNTQERDNSATE